MRQYSLNSICLLFIIYMRSFYFVVLCLFRYELKSQVSEVVLREINSDCIKDNATTFDGINVSINNSTLSDSQN
jgi:hypothetical protein